MDKKNETLSRSLWIKMNKALLRWYDRNDDIVNDRLSVCTKAVILANDRRYDNNRVSLNG